VIEGNRFKTIKTKYTTKTKDQFRK